MNTNQTIFYLIVGLSAVTVIKYLIYVFTSPFYLLNKDKYISKLKKVSQKDIENKIKISAIVPAWNEEVGILNSVMSLLLSTYNNLEVIVIDDGSSDNTLRILKSFKKSKVKKYLTQGKTFRFYKKRNGGKGSALNYGIKKSTGNLIVTMDADTIFDADALANVAKYFMDKSVDAAVGNVKIANSHSFLGLIQQIEYTIGFYFKRTHSVFNSEYIIGGAFGAFRKNLFEKHGYFDEVIKTEDIELSTRLQSKGSKIIYMEDAIAYTEGPDTLKGLMKQRLRWKKGRLDTFAKYRKLFFSRDKRHSKFLTHYLLPITLFYELELLIEPMLFLFGMVYFFRTSDFRAIILWIIFTSAIHIIAFVFGSKRNSKFAMSITPLYFLFSYVLTAIEIYAIYESIRLILKKEDVVWQNWNRKGIALRRSPK